MKVSIIVPVYNEAKTIRQILSRVEQVKFPKGITQEIIIVDDGSFDNTLAEIEKLKSKRRLIQHHKNLGKGAAVRTGIRHATGDVILIQDADLEYNPQDFPALLTPFSDSKIQVVYGSRLMNYPLVLFGKNRTPLPLHWLANKVLTVVTNMLYGQNITDMETGYKVVRRSLINSLHLSSRRFDIEPEITAKILKKGITIHEVPIRVQPRTYAQGKKIGWHDGLAAVWVLVKYRIVE